MKKAKVHRQLQVKKAKVHRQSQVKKAKVQRQSQRQSQQQPQQQAGSRLDHMFFFELLRAYPEARSFVVKKPLRSSMRDTVLELLGGRR